MVLITKKKENNFLDLATSGDEIDGENWPESKSNRTAGDGDLDVALQYHCSKADLVQKTISLR